MKRMAILTRDCAGVNAAIRAAVRTATPAGIEVLGVLRGYEGLIDGDFVPLDRRSVSGIINAGGTILKTSRCERFFTAEGQVSSVKNIKARGIDGLLIIGGNGSLAGAHVLASSHGVKVIGIPATIDNDLSGVDITIGADTAVNVALDALDKIRDTATSLERIFIVEVMGRKCGSIAMQVALAGGCEEVLLPEQDYDPLSMCREIQNGHARGKVSWIIITAEGKARAQDAAAVVTRETGLETRIAVLGHIQRGGRPTAMDRILAARLGHAAVEALIGGKSDVCVHYRNGQIEFLPLEIAIRPKACPVADDYHLLKVLA
ncbi:MAG: ATP-dependent 6-phosphofructokinase [Candidatus Aminicenantales bacterium]